MEGKYCVTSTKSFDMSRIGKAPINVPSGVTLTINDSNVTVKGPKGELSQQVSEKMELNLEDGVFTISRPDESKESKSLHGLYRALINNMVIGVTEGYKRELELVGVGFKAESKGNLLELNLGYSHNIYFQIPSELKVTTETVKGKPPLVTLEGTDKQLIGHIAAEIRSLRKPEPYKGKGVKFKGEIIRRKAGKAAKK